MCPSPALHAACLGREDILVFPSSSSMPETHRVNKKQSLCQCFPPVSGRKTFLEKYFNQTSANVLGPLPLFLIKFHGNMATLIHLHIVCSCFRSRQQRGIVVTATGWPTKTNAYYLALTEKVAVPALNNERRVSPCGKEDVATDGCQLPLGISLHLSPPPSPCLLLVHSGGRQAIER